MGYIRRKYSLCEDIKAYKFLMNQFNINMSEAQKWIDKKRVYLDGKILEIKNANIKGNVEIIFFKPNPAGLKPIFETEDFAVFDKPSGVLVHPNNLADTYSLNDEIKALYGFEANVVHRIDKETSGLVLVSKNKKNETLLKRLFEERLANKEYIALVKGKIDSKFRIDVKLKADIPSSTIRIKSHVCQDGQAAVTDIAPLNYFKNIDKTIVKAYPKTGRTHQIRAHLFHVKHNIVGDPIYGVDEKNADKFLNGKMSDFDRIRLSGASRLMLHADILSFRYKSKEYNIKSKYNFKELCIEYCNHK